MKITVVRHLEAGPAESDVDRQLIPQYQDTLDTFKHTVRGTDQHGMASYFSHAFVSPYVRTRQTLEILNGTYGLAFESTDLRESAHSGYGVDARLHGKLLTSEESVFECKDRVHRFLGTLSRMEGVTSALDVTHGDVVNAFRWCLEGLTFEQFVALYADPINFIGFGHVLKFDTSVNTMDSYDGVSGALKFSKVVHAPFDVTAAMVAVRVVPCTR